VQKIGLKTRDILALVADSDIVAYERCSGHDGTYAVKSETRAKSVKIARPTVKKVDAQAPDHLISDCPMAGAQIADLAESVDTALHPMTLLRMAYGF
jgi:Fe-S oxidoreductase